LLECFLESPLSLKYRIFGEHSSASVYPPLSSHLSARVLAAHQLGRLLHEKRTATAL
jgi:hypothetical protein